jgi:hypothetical protein
MPFPTPAGSTDSSDGVQQPHDHTTMNMMYGADMMSYPGYAAVPASAQSDNGSTLSPSNEQHES